MKLYQHIAREVDRIKRLRGGGFMANPDTVQADLDKLIREKLPSGSGFDAGTKLVQDKCTDTRLVFTTSFHHMDEHGGYNGWTEHEVYLVASLQFDFNVRVTGRDRNQIKDYIAETFQHALSEEVV